MDADFGSGELLRAIGVVATGIGGFLMGYAAVVSARREGKKECEEEKDDKVDLAD